MKIDVRECEAGPVVDAACAEALGFVELPQGDYGSEWLHVETGAMPMGLPKYSTEIAPAWELVEAMGEKWFVVQVEMVRGSHCSCIVFDWSIEARDGNVAEGYANTMPLAICRAFLLAHGVTELEVE